MVFVDKDPIVLRDDGADLKKRDQKNLFVRDFSREKLPFYPVLNALAPVFNIIPAQNWKAPSLVDKRRQRS